MSANKIKQSIRKIEEVGTITNVIIDSNDEQLLNILRRSMMENIPIYAIEYVVFIVKKCARVDEALAMRLGQLPIIQSSFNHPDNDNIFHKATLNVKGPKKVTSRDIKGVSFRDEHPIITLLDGEILQCDLYIVKGTGFDHVKFRPVSSVSINNIDNMLVLGFKNLGMLTGEDILNQAIANIERSINRTTNNMFFVPLIPRNL